MSSVFRIIGAGAGWMFARWEGAIAGFILGSMVDEYVSGPAPKSSTAQNPYHAYSTGPAAGFNYSLLALTAAVMQSNGKATRSELDYVRSFFTRQFGPEKTKENLLVLRELLKKSIPLEVVCVSVSQHLNYNGRVQLLHYLFGIASAGNSFSPGEQSLLNRISQMLGISVTDFRSVAAMFATASASVSYRILGINPDVSNEEVKKAYRLMALQSHPDKVSHLGEDVRRGAEEKFKKIQAAYENIKKTRGFA